MKNQIKQIRETFGLSQSTLASALEVSKASLGQWERGVYKTPADVIKKIADKYRDKGLTIKKYNSETLFTEWIEEMASKYSEKAIYLDIISKIENKELLYSQELAEYLDKFNISNTTFTVLKRIRIACYRHNLSLYTENDDVRVVVFGKRESFIEINDRYVAKTTGAAYYLYERSLYLAIITDDVKRLNDAIDEREKQEKKSEELLNSIPQEDKDALSVHNNEKSKLRKAHENYIKEFFNRDENLMYKSFADCKDNALAVKMRTYIEDEDIDIFTVDEDIVYLNKELYNDTSSVDSSYVGILFCDDEWYRVIDIIEYDIQYYITVKLRGVITPFAAENLTKLNIPYIQFLYGGRDLDLSEKTHIYAGERFMAIEGGVVKIKQMIQASYGKVLIAELPPLMDEDAPHDLFNETFSLNANMNSNEDKVSAIVRKYLPDELSKVEASTTYGKYDVLPIETVTDRKLTYPKSTFDKTYNIFKNTLNYILSIKGVELKSVENGKKYTTIVLSNSSRLLLDILYYVKFPKDNSMTIKAKYANKKKGIISSITFKFKVGDSAGLTYIRKVSDIHEKIHNMTTSILNRRLLSIATEKTKVTEFAYEGKVLASRGQSLNIFPDKISNFKKKDLKKISYSIKESKRGTGTSIFPDIDAEYHSWITIHNDTPVIYISEHEKNESLTVVAQFKDLKTTLHIDIADPKK